MTTLKAEKRDMSTKAKKLRREGYVTGNVFGREISQYHCQNAVRIRCKIYILWNCCNQVSPLAKSNKQ